MKKGALIKLLPLLLLPLLVASDCEDIGLPPSAAEAEVWRTPVWSPDGTRIVFNYAYGIYAVESGGALPPELSGFASDDPFHGDFSPSISPDGSQVAFSTFRHESGGMVFGRLFGGTRNFEIATSAPDGSDYRRLTDHKALDTNPVWSPDGTRIAFLSYRVADENRSYDSFPEIYTMAADGSDVRIVTPPSLRITKDPPVWSPDGRRIAFLTDDEDVRNDDGRARVLYTISADGSDLRRIARTSTRPAWSLDGSRIAFALGPELPTVPYTARPDGSDLQQVPDSGQYTYVSQLSWSVDGSEIRFVGRQYHPAPGGGSGDVEAVHAIKVDGSSVRKIAPLAYFGEIPIIAWSPDRTRIAVRDYSRNPVFLNPSPGSLPADGAVLYTLAADGSDKRILAWTEDGRLVTQ